jgi:hypothetical protein
MQSEMKDLRAHITAIRNVLAATQVTRLWVGRCASTL